MADFDLIVIGSGPGGYVLSHPRKPARHEDSHHRARVAGRHLSQLGLYPNQSPSSISRSVTPR